MGGFQIRLAPVVILWYVEGNAMDEAGERLRELVHCGALGYGPDKNSRSSRRPWCRSSTASARP